MKKVLVIVSIVVILLGALFLGLRYKIYSEVEAFDKTPIDVRTVKDGIYEGHSETLLVKVGVRVVILDGKIKNIEILKHECGKGKPANSIVEDMVKINGVEVDAVSGATISSEVIKDAVRNALRN